MKDLKHLSAIVLHGSMFDFCFSLCRPSTSQTDLYFNNQDMRPYACLKSGSMLSTFFTDERIRFSFKYAWYFWKDKTQKLWLHRVSLCFILIKTSQLQTVSQRCLVECQLADFVSCERQSAMQSVSF